MDLNHIHNRRTSSFNGGVAYIKKPYEVLVCITPEVIIDVWSLMAFSIPIQIVDLFFR